MGGNCCKDANEETKEPIFLPGDDHDGNSVPDPNPLPPKNKPGDPLNPPRYPNDPTNGGNNSEQSETKRIQQQLRETAEAERQRILREEQMRLDSIISDAARDMVPLGGGANMGGGGGYADGHGLGGGIVGHSVGGVGTCYDPGHAASIKQDLLTQGQGMGNSFVLDLHAAYTDMDDTDNASVDGRLAILVSGRNQIPPTTIEDGIAAVEVLTRRIDFTDGMEFLEDAAERFLASVICSKEGLFQDVGPIVENLP